MGPKRILLTSVILPYLAIYMISGGPQEVPPYSPAQWWPAAQEILFVFGVILIMLMTIWDRVESTWLFRQRRKPAEIYRQYRYESKE